MVVGGEGETYVDEFGGFLFRRLGLSGGCRHVDCRVLSAVCHHLYQ